MEGGNMDCFSERLQERERPGRRKDIEELLINY